MILIAASVISYVTSAIDGSADITEPAIILAICFLNAVMGTVQEIRAEKSLDALKKLSAPTATVIRGGKRMTIPAAEVTVGDIILLKTGDIVSADARLIECRSLSADESALTGESMSVEKKTAPIDDPTAGAGDMANMVFASTAVSSGTGRAVVTAVGMNTETGSIAELLMSEQESETPLERRLDRTGRMLGICALVICALIFLIGVLKHMPVFDMLMTSVSLAVAAIPEGLSAVVTVILAMGVARMAKRGAIVRTLSATEALGAATVICTDKTGTLTENKMTVTDFTGSPEKLLTYAVICSDPDNANATERAILESAAKRGIRPEFKSVSVTPFSSETKLMQVTARYVGREVTVIKGAPERILARSAKTDIHGKCVAITGGMKREIEAENEKNAADALRSVAVAYDTGGGFIFAGVIYLADPIRAEAADAVAVCARAGIRTVMITGDHPATAKAVAEKAGIISDGRIMTGAELDALDDNALRQAVREVNVFARVTPADKARIVTALKANGETVAMTGDGVNDAPSLKLADIGCGMGITGTEVAKSAADIILTDDNFSTIAEAVRIGRGIYDNIKKAVQFLLSSNIGEIMTVFSCLVLGWQTPLAPIQLLWVNLVTDSLPAAALGLDPADHDIMKRAPLEKDEPLFSMGTMLIEGLMIGSLALVAFSLGVYLYGIATARTMTFAVLAVSQLFHAFNMRSEHSIFKAGIFKNKFLVLSLVVGIILQVSVIMIPQAAAIFATVPLTPMQWSITALLCVMPVVIVELQKAVSARE